MGVNQYVSNTPPAESGSSGSYLVYLAILNQSGTSAPVATPINSGDSNYLGNIVWTYVNVGTYRGALNGVFQAGKVVAFGTLPATDGIFSFQLDSGDDSILVYTSYSVDGSLSNNYFAPGSIYIIVKQ